MSNFKKAGVLSTFGVLVVGGSLLGGVLLNRFDLIHSNVLALTKTGTLTVKQYSSTSKDVTVDKVTIDAEITDISNGIVTFKDTQTNKEYKSGMIPAVSVDKTYSKGDKLQVIGFVIPEDANLKGKKADCTFRIIGINGQEFKPLFNDPNAPKDAYLTIGGGRNGMGGKGMKNGEGRMMNNTTTPTTTTKQ